MAHCFGMNDVYNNEGHDQNGTSCVMERFESGNAHAYYQAVLSRENESMGFCASCKETMKDLTSNIDIQGNVTNNNGE